MGSGEARFREPVAVEMSRWFVMLYHPSGYPTPIVIDAPAAQDVHVMTWPSEAEADEAMKSHPAATAWGYEAYEWPA